MSNVFASRKLRASYGARELAEKDVFNIVNTSGRLGYRMFKNNTSRIRKESCEGDKIPELSCTQLPV